jgi:glyoxylase-like metal-dependent hydrolase (beta-lactamase superfamily II)
MDLVELTPRLHMLRFSVGQAYLWYDGADLTLIDTGPAGNADAIRAAAGGLGTLRRIVLTHSHEDHAGSAAELDLPVYAHKADAPIIRGDEPGPPPDFTDWERELHARVAQGLPPAPPARVDVELDDGDSLDGGITVIAVPGHTEGSIALHVPAERVLFTGDVIAEHEGGLMFGPFNVDRTRAEVSARRLARFATDNGVEIACFGHGEPVVGGAGERLRQLHG